MATVSHVVLGFWSLLVIVPLLWTLLSSFKTSKEIFASPFGLPANWNFDNYVSAWTTQGIGRYFLNTVIVVGCALVIVMILGSMCAYVLACFSFPGRRFIYYSMLAGLTFPIFMAIVPLFFVLKQIGLLNTLPGLIITYVAFALPFTVFFLYPVLQGAAEGDLRGRGGRRRGRVAEVLPGDAADGRARHGVGGDLQLPRPVEPVPAARRPQHQAGELRPLAGDGVVRVPGGLQRRLRPPVRAVVITVVPVLVVYAIFQRQLQGSVTQGTSK